jgi:predicted RecB family nuclease
MILTAILIGSFSVFIFRAIDSNTVDSYYPRLEDAYWIEPQYRRELPKVGIATFDDLLSKTREKKEMDELALRLLISKELLIQWVEKARLVQLNGLGVENLRLLEGVGIGSISALAKEDPEILYDKIEQVSRERVAPQKAKIGIWVREAQKKVRSSELRIKSYQL